MRAGSIVGGAVGLVALLGVAAIGSAGVIELRATNKAHAGVRFQGTDIGGKTAEEIFSLAAVKAQSYYNTPGITLKAGERSVTFKPSEFGAGVDPAVTVQRALGVGRNGSVGERLLERWAAYNGRVDIAAQNYADAEAANRILARFASEVERPVRDATLRIEGISVRETPAQTGYSLDTTDAARKVAAAISAGKAAELQLPVREIAPKVTSVKEAAEEANRILLADVAVLMPRWDENGTAISPSEAARIRANDVRDLLSFDETGGKLAISIKADRLKTMIAPLAPALARDAEDARFVFDEASKSLRVVQPEKKGRVIDVDGTVSEIVNAIKAGGKQVSVQYRETTSRLNAQTKAQDLGITGLVSQATTNFAGSSAARVKNIKVAAARYHGIVIAPGATFSFNEFLGDVSEKEGFEEGLVIVGDRTIKGVGGGVCQVSTTAYQAALRAGMPVTERYPHGYRVGYYERGMGAGYDSTVFSPYVDLKFVNDFMSHLLVETYFNPGGTLTFKFYGAPDSREVVIGKSTIGSVIKHGPDIYEPDPDGKLKEKQVQQVDYATDGATVSFTRQVKKDGKVVLNETVNSKYVPWQNVFRFGPGFTPPEGAVVRSPKP